MKTLLIRLKEYLFPSKPKRLELRYVRTYPEGNDLCMRGWTIAKEDDTNKQSGWVYLELLEGVDNEQNYSDT